MDRRQADAITDSDGLKRHLDALAARDPRLVPVVAIAGEVPLRRGEPGFAGMARIVVSQLLSVASADAIHRRFEIALGEVAPARFLQMEEAEIRACGISGGKYRTLTGLAEAETRGAVDYEALVHLEAEEAIAELTRHKGIGRWTAEIYLLFCLGHPDIFPAGDLALQKMVAHALALEARPDEKATRQIASAWAPHRGAAARLLWRYFAALKQKEGVSL